MRNVSNEGGKPQGHYQTRKAMPKDQPPSIHWGRWHWRFHHRRCHHWRMPRRWGALISSISNESRQDLHHFLTYRWHHVMVPSRTVHLHPLQRANQALVHCGESTSLKGHLLKYTGFPHHKRRIQLHIERDMKYENLHKVKAYPSASQGNHCNGQFQAIAPG